MNTKSVADYRFRGSGLVSWFSGFVNQCGSESMAAKTTGYDAWLAGRVKKDGARKAVEIPSLGLTFEGDTLQVR